MALSVLAVGAALIQSGFGVTRIAYLIAFKRLPQDDDRIALGLAWVAGGILVVVAASAVYVLSGGWGPPSLFEKLPYYVVGCASGVMASVCWVTGDLLRD